MSSMPTQCPVSGNRNIGFTFRGRHAHRTAPEQRGPLAGLIGARVPNIQVGTAVTLTYPRHPQALASAALSVQAATGNRFVLGVGPGHRPAIEARFGISDDKPAAHVRDYLTRLSPLLNDTTRTPCGSSWLKRSSRWRTCPTTSGTWPGRAWATWW